MDERDIFTTEENLETDGLPHEERPETLAEALSRGERGYSSTRESQSNAHQSHQQSQGVQQIQASQDIQNSQNTQDMSKSQNMQSTQSSQRPIFVTEKDEQRMRRYSGQGQESRTAGMYGTSRTSQDEYSSAGSYVNNEKDAYPEWESNSHSGTTSAKDSVKFGPEGSGQWTSSGFDEEIGYENYHQNDNSTSSQTYDRQPDYSYERQSTYYASDFNTNQDRNYDYDPRYGRNIPPDRPPKKAKEKKTVTLTRGKLALLIVACILCSTVLSFFVNSAYDSYTSVSSGTATNYTLVSSDETLSYASIIDKAEESVVSITTESVTTDSWMREYITEGAGSGVIIQEDGYIMTCAHVVDDANTITVTLYDGTEYDATLIGYDEENDIAVIKINATGLVAVTYGDSDALEVGDQVVAIGNPLGVLGGTATTGIISALNREITIDDVTMTLLQTDASINPGNSGGGLFDASGNLIGIVVAKSSGSEIEGLGFAIPINTAAEVAKNIIQNGSSSSSSSSDSSSGSDSGSSTDDSSEDSSDGYTNDTDRSLWDQFF